MNKRFCFCIILSIWLTPATIIGQKLVKNKVDEFTKAEVKETSWEPFTKTFRLRSFLRVRKVDSLMFFELKFMASQSVASMREGAEIMLMLEDGPIVTLRNFKYEISCRGCGTPTLAYSNHHGLDIKAIMSPKEAAILASQPIKKIRLYLSDGYTEEEVNKKQGDVLQKELELIGVEK